MESSLKQKKEVLIHLLETFIAGDGGSLDFVRELEGQFAACGLDADDRFSDLQQEIATYDARKGSGTDLSRECRHALKLLRAELNHK